MTTYEWRINNLERSQEDYITIVHWSCSGDDGTNTASSYGTVSFNQEEGEEIIPFANLTEELVKGWMFEKLNKEEVEAAVQAKLDELANPPLISGLPW
jgi:hypothetical protein